MYLHFLRDCFIGSALEGQYNRTFRCQQKNKKRNRSKTHVSVFKSSFSSYVHLTPQQITELVCCMALYYEATSSLTDCFSCLRQGFITWVVNNSQELGVVVAIDEAQIAKGKYNRGRYLQGVGVWRKLKGGPRNFSLLRWKIERRILCLWSFEKNRPGTTIFSDCWRSNDRLDEENYIHVTVNHSINFVNSGTGAQTQNMELIWMEVRKNVPRFGRKKTHCEGYLPECLFTMTFPDHT